MKEKTSRVGFPFPAVRQACCSVLIVLSLAGCGGRENEYERCLTEKMKDLPQFVSAPMIEDALKSYRALSAEEQEAALAKIRNELARRHNGAVEDALNQP